MKPQWKIIGLAGLAGVAATGVIIAGKRRAQRDYDPDELRERLHSRLAGASTSGVTSPLDASTQANEPD
ncbi:MAG: hypothetical protein ACLP0J_18095 [Solirubrobacteraceae bacterium]|jgi:hypothetical protein